MPFKIGFVKNIDYIKFVPYYQPITLFLVAFFLVGFEVKALWKSFF